ncbi:MAG: RNA polymerase sigma factor [Actinomycetota bacterium]
MCRWAEGGSIQIAAEVTRSRNSATGNAPSGYTDSELQRFTDLYLRYREPIKRYLSRRTNDAATADDLTAQVFLKAMNGADGFRGEGAYRSWLFQIARNTLINWRAEKARLQIPVEEVPDEETVEDSPTVVALVREERDLLLDAVADLPEAQQEVVRLRYWRDLSIDEIAHLTGRTSGSIRALLHRSRRTMARRLNAKDMSVILGATGAAASLAIYSAHRQRRRRR